MPNDRRRIGFAASSHPELFPSPRLRLVSSDRSFEIYDDLELILSRVRLFRAPSFRLLAHRLSARAPPALEFSALFATSPVRSHSSATTPTSSLRSVIRFSRPLDVFLRTRACRLISSRCHVQDSFPFRGFSPRAAALPLRKALPPCRWLLVALTRLRRLPPDQDLGFEAFIRARPRSMQNRYSQRCKSLPSSGSAPPGIQTSFGWTRFTRVLRSRPSFVPPSLFAIAFRLGPQRLSRQKPGVASPLRLACSSFRAFPPTLRARYPNSPPVALR
jgi:hypothetical protein